jgi:hypothetical protein
MHFELQMQQQAVQLLLARITPPLRLQATIKSNLNVIPQHSQVTRTFSLPQMTLACLQL